MGLLEDVKEKFSGLKDAGPAFVIEFVGEQFVRPFLQDILKPWNTETVLKAVARNDHIYPLYPPEIRQEWREKAKAYGYAQYRDRVSMDMLFRWVRASRPDLTDAIMREKGGWAWLVEELSLISGGIFPE